MSPEDNSNHSLIYHGDHQNNLEGQVRILASKFFKLTKLKAYFVLPLLTILSGFVILLVIRKNRKVLANLIGTICQVQEATHILIEGNDHNYSLETIYEKQFVFRKIKYSVETLTPIAYSLEQSPYFYNKKYLQHGLSQLEYQSNVATYGYCEHIIQIPNIFVYLLDELLGIFFILQYITCIVYIYEGFLSFACLMLGFSLLTTIINYVMLVLSYKKIKQIAQHSFHVRVLREGKITEILSRELVPGDLFIPEGSLPCDCILVKGEVFVNEVNLTGQNIPISKTPLKSLTFSKLTSQNWMFQGSMILETRGSPLALVVHTGFITRKGRIFRKLIFREIQQPEFFKYAFIFMIQVFIYCLVIFFGMMPVMKKNNISDSLIVLRFFDMVGWAIPPALPICFNFSYTVSMIRLRQKGIFGTEPHKTIVSGKIKTMCFDKTGTLTKNIMNLHSIIQFEENNLKQIVVKDNQLQLNQFTNKIMGSCHSVRLIDGQFLGDQLDLRMFMLSKYTYHESTDMNIKLVLKRMNVSLEVLRINQFQSKFQDMSILVRDGSNHYIFVKGAPQKIHFSSSKKYDNFNDVLSRLSLSGLRCLGIGYKIIDNPSQYVEADRSAFNEGIKMCGLVTFSNELKSQTRETIMKMHQSSIQPKMITGDNIYIGVQTALQSGIFSSVPVLLLRGEKQTSKQYFQGELLKKQSQNTWIQNIKISRQQYLNQTDYPIAIDESFMKYESSIPSTVKVFARISPETKALVVKKLMRLKKIQWESKSFLCRLFSRTSQKVGMCGDGANDLIAIKQADLGIGISNTDGSFAADFAVPEIEGVDYVVRQGKATLQIVIELFQFYGGISILKFIGAMFCIIDKSSFKDIQFTYFNYASTIEILIFLCFSKPKEEVSTSNPNDNLMSLQNHALFIGLLLIQSVGLLGVWLFITSNSHFQPTAEGYITSWIFSSQVSTAIFLSSHILFIFHALWVYRSDPWKKNIWHNYVLSIWMLIIIGVNTAFFFITGKLSFLGVVQLDFQVGVFVFLITLGTLLACLVWVVIIKCLKKLREE